MILQPIILSGGSGSRLWPLSREQFPKQLHSFQGKYTLLQQTAQRLDGLQVSTGKVAAPMVVCNEQHRFLVAEQLRAINCESGSILLEPVGRNTAPAVTVAALACIDKDDDAILLVMPADHIISDPAEFHRATNVAAELASDGVLVAFGIRPAHAETGYGYIHMGDALPTGNASTIKAFVEKPDAATASAMLESGEFVWNSGIFVMRASCWLEQLAAQQPDMLAACQQAYAGAVVDLDFCRLDTEAFAACPSDSIDYTVMEKLNYDAQNVSGQAIAAVVPVDVGWSDLGAWSALLEIGESDDNGNVIRGDVLTHGCRNNLFHAEHRLMTAVGVENLLVVETVDAIMVAHKDNAQEVKKIVEQLAADGRSEGLMHRQVYRPWGSYEGVDAGERFQVKRIVVKPGAALSLQMHHHRAEHWIVVKGTAQVTCGDKVFLLSENQSTYIPIGQTHRLENPGAIPLELIEVQSGSYLGEDDIVRFEDRYGREDLAK